jgi:L1 cell adhesion molecule like protein
MFKRSHKLGWVRTYDQLLLASKLQHKNIVKVLGYGHEVGSSSIITRLLKYKMVKPEKGNISGLKNTCQTEA